MTADALIRPVWDALSTRQARFAVGDDRARRFTPEVGPLAGARADDPASLASLAALVPVDGSLLLLQADPIVLPPELVATTTAPGVQMVLGRLADVGPDPRVTPLTVDDVPAMLELAALTKPGPLAARTLALGDFFGIKDDGVLVAMAGERMKHAGYVEVSSVCTHPDARGRGLARILSAHVARRIAERGETPYLHAYASNVPAIRLYETLGFRLHRAMHVAVIGRAAR